MNKVLDSNKEDQILKVVISIEKKLGGIVNMIFEDRNDIKDIKSELHDHEKRIENLEIKK